MAGTGEFYTEGQEFAYDKQLENNMYNADAGNKDELDLNLDEVQKQMGTLQVGDEGVAAGDSAAPVAAAEPSHVIKMRGLPWESTEDDIMEFFKAANITPSSVFIITNHQGKASGRAFVQCADAADKEAALSLTNQNMGHRYIELMSCTEKEWQRAQARNRPQWQNQDAPAPYGKGPAQNPNAVVLRLRGLPFSATEVEIKQFFGTIECGAVHLGTDQYGRSSGEAFVEFDTEEAAAEALKLNKQNLSNRYIEIFRSSVDELARRRPIGPSVADDVILIRMRGLPFSATEDELKQFFNPIVVANVYMLRDHAGRPSGEAFVEVSSNEDAEEAMKLDKENLGKRYVELFRATAADLQMAFSRSVAFHSGGGRGRGRGGRGRYRGGAVQYNNGYKMGYQGNHLGRGRGQQRAPVSESTVVRMQGIPFSATDQDIHQFFSAAGANPIRLHRRLHGGEGYAEFSTPQLARAALSLHKSHIGSRYIELVLVSYEELAEFVAVPHMAHQAHPPHQHQQQHPHQQHQQHQQQHLPHQYGALGVGVGNGSHNHTPFHPQHGQHPMGHAPPMHHGNAGYGGIIAPGMSMQNLSYGHDTGYIGAQVNGEYRR